MTGFAYDIVVVGAGHAGVEAALAAARLGVRCALLTHDAGAVGRMPCNPAIGGLGKGHLVREIDVLGGEMGVAIDQSGIQFRLLNTKKGPAVQSPRAQADKQAYQDYMTATCHGQPGLTVLAADVSGLTVATGPQGRRVVGVELANGGRVSAARVILCTGTFMKGLMHIGADRIPGGREGGVSSEGLSGGLADYGFVLKRLKTGTPPRLLNQTIDYKHLTEQKGDVKPTPFSFRTRAFNPQQVSCHLAYTHPGTHKIIVDNLGRSPLFAGVISGQGPRYCPSIEDKVVRFADKDRHLLFLEPEGLKTDEVYVNGLSTSLPADVQLQVVRSIPGLEHAEIVRYGYAVEYDSVPSWQVFRHLETKVLAGLYLAGQILGTSGYEEAAAQGLVAGVNATFSLDGRDPLSLPRTTSYLGVLVDDLVTKEINEPYRMFTSRAEHRLHLRCDNTEGRLSGLAAEIGLLPVSVQGELDARNSYVEEMKLVMDKYKFVTRAKGVRVAASDYLRFPGTDLAMMAQQEEIPPGLRQAMATLRAQLGEVLRDERAVEAATFQVENDIKYAGYIAKQERLLRTQSHLDHCEMPADFDYQAIKALSYEAREKLSRVRPITLGQASRIDGVRAGDLAVLTIFLKKLQAAIGFAGSGTISGASRATSRATSGVTGGAAGAAENEGGTDE